MVSGQVAYDGPPSRLAGFFYGMGFEPPPFENPADFYLKVVNDRGSQGGRMKGRRGQEMNQWPFFIFL